MRVRKEQLWQKDSWHESGLRISTSPLIPVHFYDNSTVQHSRQTPANDSLALDPTQMTSCSAISIVLYVASIANMCTCVCVSVKDALTNFGSRWYFCIGIRVYSGKGTFRSRWQVARVHMRWRLPPTSQSISALCVWKKNRKRANEINERLKNAVQPSVSLCLLYTCIYSCIISAYIGSS